MAMGHGAIQIYNWRRLEFPSQLVVKRNNLPPVSGRYRFRLRMNGCNRSLQCKSRSGGTAELSPPRPLLSAICSRFQSERSWFSSKNQLSGRRGSRRDGDSCSNIRESSPITSAFEDLRLRLDGRSATGPVESPRRSGRPALPSAPAVQPSNLH